MFQEAIPFSFFRNAKHDLRILADADAARVPFSEKRNMGQDLRLKSGSQPADFPPELMPDENQND